jgi:hypothetical protein
MKQVRQDPERLNANNAEQSYAGENASDDCEYNNQTAVPQGDLESFFPPIHLE